MDSVSQPVEDHSESVQQGTLNSERIICNGCKLTLEESGMANDSVVVSFGNSLWHVDCFRCAKCRNLVEHDTNLLLLSDGSPVCENCSYICSVCKQPISNEAIVTGEESYHADCFRCRSCSNRIEELIFAKTSQGIYCMTCHNQRVTRSRRHAEAKRNKATTNHGSSNKQKDKDRDKDRERDKDKDRDRDRSRQKPTIPQPHSPPLQPFPLVDPSRSPHHQVFDSHLSSNPLVNSSTAPRSLDPKPSVSSLANPRPLSSLDSTLPPLPSTSSDQGHLALQSKQSAINFLSFRRRGGSTSSVQPPPSIPPIGPHTHQPDKSRPSASAVPRPSTADGGANHSSSPRPLPFKSSAIHRSYESSPHIHSIPDPLMKTDPTSPSKSSYPSHPPKSKLLDIASDMSSFKSQLKHRTASLDSFGNITPQPPPHLARSQVHPDSEGHLSGTKFGTPLFSYNEIFSSLDHRPGSPLLSSSFLNNPQRSRDQYDIENILPSYASNDINDPLAIPASSKTEPGETLDQLNNVIENANDDLQGLGLDLGLVEKLLWELDETKQKMIALQDEYHQIGRGTPSTLEGSIGFTTKQSSFRREDVELKMKDLKIKMFEQASKLRSMDSFTSLEHQSEKLKDAVIGLQNHLRQLVIERDFRVTEIETLNDLRDQLKKDGNIHQPPDQVLIAKFQQIRDQYLGETRQLASERDQLKEEVTHLNKIRESQAKELDALNRRFDALSEMNAAAVKRLEETRSITARIQGRSGGPTSVKAMLTSPTAGANLSTNENDMSPEVNIATTRKFKWGKSHAQKTSATTANARNNYSNHTQNSGLSSVSGADSTLNNNNNSNNSSNNNSNNNIITITNNSNLALNDGNSQANNNNNHPNSNSLNSINNNSASNLTTVSHHSSNNTQAIAGSTGNNTAIANSSASSTQQQQQPSNSNTSNNSHNPTSITNMRPHTFQPVSALRPVRCDYCGDKLWGLAEVRCTACGSYSHTKCAANFFGCQASSIGNGNYGATSMTTPGLVNNNEEDVDSVLFGNDLILQAKLENKLVPNIVIKCIEAVERHGIKLEGIYRKTGGMSSVKMIQNCFEKGTSMDFNDLDKFNDISAITSTLKNYFRQLPNPLFTFELHEAFVTVASMGSEAIRLEALERVIYQLPLVHFETLKVLMTHLSNIEKLSEFNKMNSQNLGVIFGPTLLRSSNPSRQFSDMPFTAKIVELTVLNKYQLFRKAYGSNTNTTTSNSTSSINSTSGSMTQSVTSNKISNLQPNSSGFPINLNNNLTLNSLSNPTTMPTPNFQTIDSNNAYHLQASNPSP